ncbi:uncharacterized protein [Diadema antillarum]|uniref:uncharacterized protein n=1 Tax=Diadema antillarum TaxID=105358 RepID=UPI003A838098
MASMEDPYSWSVDDVSDWLRRERFSEFVESFRQVRVDGIALYELQKEKFDSLTRSSMGRDDRASMLWRNINIIKSRAKSNRLQKRKPPPMQPGPPQTPPRDYFPQKEDPADNEEDDDIDCFTDDEDDVQSDDSNYMEPSEEPARGPPIPSRPGQNLNASWGGSQTSSQLTELQRGLMRKMSERGVGRVPTQDQSGACNQDDLYLAPTEEDADDVYDIPDASEGDGDDIYDIPDDVPDTHQSAPPPRQPPPSQQRNRLVTNAPGPRMPEIPKNRVRPPINRINIPVSSEPPAPPIPSRKPVEPIETEEEYAVPVEDDEAENYIEPDEDENYLEPGVQSPPPQKPSIQRRELPCVPAMSIGAKLPPRPSKPGSLSPTQGNAPPIPQRPSPAVNRWNAPESKTSNSNLLPGMPNGDRPRSPPNPRIPELPKSTQMSDSDKENGNFSSGPPVSSRVNNLLNKFEGTDNNNSDRPFAKTPWQKPERSNNSSSNLIQRVTPPTSSPRRTGMPASTISTTSASSIGSTSSSGSEGAPPPPRKFGKPGVEATWSDMPPLPTLPTQPPLPSPIPTQPPLPAQPNRPTPPAPGLEPNKSSLMKIAGKNIPPVPRAVTPPPPSEPSRPLPPVNPGPDDGIEGYPWYHADIDRVESERILTNCRRNGAFVVRPGKDRQNKPFSLSLWYNGRVRNLQIRHRMDRKYALGSQKDHEIAFDTPVQLIQHHMTNPLILAQDQGRTMLTIPAPRF